ncbi:MAG TPA: FemAB family PEP-CTERM system-associated protein [Candidatus Competibacter sp.]|nr:FemAB family PEP-CTERM system-associated protein [Candidatus Competibacter sp.]
MVFLSESDKNRWNAFVQAADDATCYHQAGWKEVIENTFGHKTFYLISEDGSKKIKGILPLVQLKSLLFGNFLVSLPYFNYGGACVSNQEGLRDLLNEAKIIAAETNAKYIEFRHARHLYEELPVKKTKVAMELALPEDAEQLLKLFPSKLRSQIKKPQKEGMSSKIGKIDEVENFYAVFSQNMRDLGTPVYSIKFFKNILKTFPDSTWICTVSLKSGLPVASAFLVGFKGKLEIPWASSLRKYNSLSPNMLLYWSVLKFACESGFRIFDFGRSTPGEGTYRFKEQWGAKPVQLYWHYWLKQDAVLPELNPKNPKYQVAIRLWQKMPVPLTRVLGPIIVKNIP